MHVIIKEGIVVRSDNPEDLALKIAQGWRNLSENEISAAGMEGFEHLVGPSNTTVREDGSICFTLPLLPQPTEKEKDQARVANVKSELQGIDAQSGRPARAVALAMVRGESPNPEDVAKLEELEIQAQALREELRQIVARLEAQDATEDRML